MYHYQTLIVSTSNKFNAMIKEYLLSTPYDVTKNILEAKKMINIKTYDFVMMNVSYPSIEEINFAIQLATKKEMIVLMFVKEDVYNTINEQVIFHGIFTLSKPFSKTTLTQALNWMVSAREQVRNTTKTNQIIEEKLHELRLVNHAKWLLMTELKMSENDAHKFIEKEAMNRCLSKAEIATNIIKNYT